jgi:AcrR family transcriptional regulator
VDTRTRILVEARELFLSAGLSGFSMRVLAERVGVSATALYRHFDDRDALLASLLGEAFSTFGGYLMRALAGPTPLDRFRLTGKAYLDFALEHPRDYELMFMTNCQDLGLVSMSEALQQRAQGTFVFLVDRLNECIEAGVFARADPRSLAAYVWTQTHGLASLWLVGQLSKDRNLAEFHQLAEFTLARLELALRANAAANPTATAH